MRSMQGVIVGSLIIKELEARVTTQERQLKTMSKGSKGGNKTKGGTKGVRQLRLGDQ